MGKIYDRKSGLFYEDKQYGERALKFLYGNPFGRVILRCFVVGKFYSEYNARKNRSPRSISKIAPFVEEYGIDLNDFESREFSSFADFFTRKLAPGRRAFSYDADDLISVGTIGLIKAINTYNPEKGTGLATYTAKCIENEILMLIRANKKHLNSVSLYDSVGSDKDGNELTLMDLIPSDKDELFEEVEKKTENKKLNELIKKCLTKREYIVIKLRFGLDGAIPLPQREVARFLKISRSYISRIEKKAIEKIREEINKSGVSF